MEPAAVVMAQVWSESPPVDNVAGVMAPVTVWTPVDVAVQSAPVQLRSGAMENDVFAVSSAVALPNGSRPCAS